MRNAKISGSRFTVGVGNGHEKVVLLAGHTVKAEISHLSTGFGVSLEGGPVLQVETNWQPGHPLAKC